MPASTSHLSLLLLRVGHCFTPSVLLLLLLLTDDMAIMRRHRETCHVSCTQRFPAVGTFDSPRVS